MNESQIRKQDVEIARISESVKYLVKGVDEIKDKLEKEYITQDQFEPVKKIVYGLVGTILLGVIGAIMALVLKS